MSFKWTPQEVDILEEMAESHTAQQIAQRLIRHRYHRSLESIRKKLYSLGYSVRPTLDNYSCNQIAKVLQVDSSTVAGWVISNSQFPIRNSQLLPYTCSRSLKAE